MTVRPATLADLDEITALGIVAMHDDPVWPYRFPKAGEYRDDHFKYSRLRFWTYLESPENGGYAVMLVEAPSKEHAYMKKIIAMSVWILPGHRLPKADALLQAKKPSDGMDRRDADPARLAKFTRELAQARETYFDEVYGDAQLGLVVLGTHPDYRRLGAAAMLLKWGQEKAEAERVTVTLFASPMGYPLYAKVGFTEVGKVHVQVDGDDASVERPLMVWADGVRAWKLEDTSSV